MKPALVRKVAPAVSPLRYPGGKRRLWGYVAEVIRLNGLCPKLFVEPFAGGASIGLQLLAEGLVEKLALADRDPLVASFWKVLFHDTAWLVERVSRIAVTVRNWRRYRNATWRSDRERAIACLFLNRTSFSGILACTAGPIGGPDQDSEYAIDCRFPVKTLVRRIKRIAALKDKIAFLRCSDWKATVREVERQGHGSKEVFYYLDPPFYNKAERLYRYFFAKEDHDALHDLLIGLEQPWLLSYDVATSIISKYSHNGRGPRRIDLLYSIAGSSGVALSQEVIVTNLSKLPARTRLWRSGREWRLRVTQ